MVLLFPVLFWSFALVLCLFISFVGFPALFLYSPVSCLLISLCVYSLMSLPWCCHGFCVFFWLVIKVPSLFPTLPASWVSCIWVLTIFANRHISLFSSSLSKLYYIFLLSLCCHHFFKQPSDKLFKGALSLFDQYSQKCKVQYHNPFVFSGWCGPITCTPCKMQLILSKQTSISL